MGSHRRELLGDQSAYANPDAGRPRGPLERLQFTLGVHEEYAVDDWILSAAAADGGFDAGVNTTGPDDKDDAGTSSGSTSSHGSPDPSDRDNAPRESSCRFATAGNSGGAAHGLAAAGGILALLLTARHRSRGRRPRPRAPKP